MKEEDIERMPGMLCVCGYDNTPLPGDKAPDSCEGCGRELS